MKKAVKFLIAVLLLLAIPVSLLAAGAALPEFYGDTYYAVLERMHSRLETAEKPKIVILGGSNVAFGLDGALLEQLLAQQGYDYTVCPFGLYAAVGTSAMLDLSQDDLGVGDIVVLAVEPTSETMSAYFGAEAFWKCAERDPGLVLEVSREKQAALVGNYIPYVQQRYGILTSGDYPVAQGVYGAASFNDRCDMVFDRPGNAMAVGWDTASPVELGAVEIDPAFAGQVNEYCAQAAEKGASVVMTFSPVNRSALADPEAAAGFFTACNAAFDCPLISDPNRYILDSGWFYDSNFHLNSAGAQLRTALLAEDLLTWLGCFRPLAYEWPEMPDPIARIPEDDANGDWFTYAPAAENAAWLVSGLTEAGTTQRVLRVPASHEGKPVIGFTGGALKNAPALAELRLPESIESLPDGLFSHTSNLTRLVLEHTGSPCAVTEHTFDGADQILIYVPEAVYPMYRDGYGCETNPWEPYLDRIRPAP